MSNNEEQTQDDSESTVVRINLMKDKTYSPYCGSDNCKKGMPRTRWSASLNQFMCSCGWVSEFPKSFILKYKSKWNL